MDKQSTDYGRAPAPPPAKSEGAAEAAQLRGDLERAQADLALARREADRAAAALQHDPTAERQKARNEAEQVIELLDLRIGRLKRDLDQAEQVARGEAQQRLLDEHAAAQMRVSEHEQSLFAGLGMIEAALSGLTEERNQTRRRQGKLKAVGWDGHSLQMAMKPSRDFVRRIEALPRLYGKVTHPIMGQ
jgi:hypothetical protein